MQTPLQDTANNFIRNPLTVIDTLFEEQDPRVQNNAHEFYQKVKSHAEQIFNTSEQFYQAVSTALDLYHLF